MKDIRRKIDKIGILRKSIMNYHFTVCFFSFEYLLKRSVNTLSDFVWICFKNIFESDHDLHFPIYSMDNQQTDAKFHNYLFKTFYIKSSAAAFRYTRFLTALIRSPPPPPIGHIRGLKMVYNFVLQVIYFASYCLQVKFAHM